MKKFVFARAFAIAKKEFFHIARDPFTLGVAFGLPIFMVIIFGLAIEFNVKYIDLAVSDSDRSKLSRELVETFGSSQYFIIKGDTSLTDVVDNLTTETARAVLIIPPFFQRDVANGRGGNAQILLDGSDSSTVVPIISYITRIQNMAATKWAGYVPNQPYEIRSRYLFNPELNSRWFVVPGINVVIMAILSVILTALTVSREYENGSMELLLTTPIQPIEIIIGKLAPYGILGLIVLALIYVLSRLGFGVPFVGNHLVFALGATLFLIAYLAQGLLISVTARNQVVALQMAMMTGLLPTQLLSGFIFPIENMPTVMQYITMILPARWFMQISRDSFLQGTGLLNLWAPFLGLSLFCLAMIFIATRKFKSDLEP